MVADSSARTVPNVSVSCLRIPCRYVGTESFHETTAELTVKKLFFIVRDFLTCHEEHDCNFMHLAD